MTQTIIITGEKGVGKTTLLLKIIEESERDFYGIVSERFDKGYYVQDVKTGEKHILCSENQIGFKFRKYYFDAAILEFIRKSLKTPGEIMVYDEIGWLEVEGKNEIWEYIKEPVLLLVRKELVSMVCSRFKAEIFEVTIENRDNAAHIILEKMETLFRV